MKDTDGMAQHADGKWYPKLKSSEELTKQIIDLRLTLITIKACHDCSECIEMIDNALEGNY